MSIFCRNSKRYFVVLFLICCFLVVLSGCANKSKSDSKGNVDLYYTNSNKTKLVTLSYDLSPTTPEQQVEELIEQLKNQPDKMNYVSAIPDSVQIVKWNINDTTLNIDFDSNYLQMGKVTELLCRSAVVLTLTQVNKVDYVSFTVNDQPIVDDTKNPIPTMKATDFVDNSGSSINNYQEAELVLYFTNEDGDKLLPYNYSGIYSQNTSMEKFIIDKLISGPKQDGYYRTLPSNLKLNSVITKDGVCYVSFDSTFMEEMVGVNPDVELYSIVNSLFELTYINKVQISINGDTDKKFREYTSLNDMFMRNLDLVEQKQ